MNLPKRPLPILIDTGSSGPAGASSRRLFRQCMQAWAYRYLLHFEPKELNDALSMGTLGHVWAAHRFARMQAVQRGEDPRSWLPSDTAMFMAARKMQYQNHVHEIAKVESAMRAYEAKYPDDAENYEILHVEELHAIDFFDVPYPGRLDRVMRDRRTGKIWIVDMKTTGRIESKTFQGHLLNGQRLGYDHMGLQYGSDYAGVMIDVVQWDPHRFVRKKIEDVPHAVREYPDTIAFFDGIRQQLADAGIDPWHYPKAFNETICVGRYGICDYAKLCMNGKASLEDFVTVDQ